MQASYTIRELASFVWKRAWIVLAAAVALSLAIGLARAGDSETGFVSSRLVRVDGAPVTFDAQTGRTAPVDLASLWQDDAFLASFIARADAQFEMRRFTSTWTHLDLPGKIAWVRGAFVLTGYPSIAQYRFAFTASAGTGSRPYVAEQAPRLLDAYVALAQESVRAVAADSAFAPLSGQDLSFPKDTSSAAIQNYAVGAFLGGLAGILALLILFLFSRTVVTKGIRDPGYSYTVIGEKRTAYDTMCHLVRTAQKQGRNAFVACSAWKGSDAAFAELAAAFAGLGRRVAVVDFAGADPAADGLRTPGRAGAALEALGRGSDYVLLRCPTPSEDALVVEIAESAAAVVFLERVGASDKAALESSLLRLGDIRTQVCVAWSADPGTRAAVQG